MKELFKTIYDFFEKATDDSARYNTKVIYAIVKEIE